jgi:Flp pilus assembly protein TadG
MWGFKIETERQATFFGRLKRDVRGNTLAMMAIALVPLSALAGSAVDMGRLYVVKVRLQQACDAGVLAGRKNMVSAGTTLDDASVAQAQTFFRNNFREGWLNTRAVAFVPSKTTDNQVQGTAAVTVPMSIMKMFKAPDITLNLACEARYDVADTDVMFVLDITGSMACRPEDSTADCSTYVGDAGTTSYLRPADGSASGNLSISGYPGSTGYYVPEKAGSRISALRAAVLSFYDTLVSTADPATKVRYGFVPYTSTVNAGRAIWDVNRAYLVGSGASDTWTYQTRKLNGEYLVENTSYYYGVSSTTCSGYAQARTPATGYDNSPPNPGPNAVMVKTSRSGTTCAVTTTTYYPRWAYNQYPLDISTYVTGAATLDPTKVTGATTRWQGCIEERFTTSGATSFPQGSLPQDLDPDLIPSTDVKSRWKPMWPEVIYGRNATPDASNGDTNSEPPIGTTAKMRSGFVSCGKPVQRLKPMTRADVSTYVNASDFRAIGGTYHDTGMIWGTRMLSRDGVFAADNQPWPGRQKPNRVLIFMTDGDMAPNSGIYGMYGYEALDQRVTAGNYGNISTYQNYHNQRFLAECSAAKNRGIDVWVVAVGQAVTTELKTCASSTDQALYAGTSSDVSEAFANIAKRTAALRISK